MSPLLLIVKFRFLSNTLTDSEFIGLLANFVKAIGREQLLSALCAGAPPNWQNQENEKILKVIKSTIEIAQNIITSRKNTNIPSSSQFKLDELPKVLIGEIGSYLPQTDYLSLSRTNRSMYIGLNDPNTLKHLDLMKVNDYSCIDIDDYFFDRSKLA